MGEILLRDGKTVPYTESFCLWAYGDDVINGSGVMTCTFNGGAASVKMG
jgi:hypothetical protein